VRPEHVELAGGLGAGEDVARVGVLGDKPQRLLLPGAADHQVRVRPGQALGRVEGPAELVVLPVERLFGIRPHLEADPDRLLELLEALRRRREVEAEAAGFVLVPGRADAEPDAATGEHVQGGDRLGQQRRLAVDDAGDQGVQQGVLGVRDDEPEGRVGLEHLVLGRAHAADLPEVVHHADPPDSGRLRLAYVPCEGRAERPRAAGPGEIGDVQSEFHVRPPCRWPTFACRGVENTNGSAA
jgi:hypothetical protein